VEVIGVGEQHHGIDALHEGDAAADP
jgi:hypothetical protein